MVKINIFLFFSIYLDHFTAWVNFSQHAHFNIKFIENIELQPCLMIRNNFILFKNRHILMDHMQEKNQKKHVILNIQSRTPTFVAFFF